MHFFAHMHARALLTAALLHNGNSLANQGAGFDSQPDPVALHTTNLGRPPETAEEPGGGQGAKL